MPLLALPRRLRARPAVLPPAPMAALAATLAMALAACSGDSPTGTEPGEPTGPTLAIVPASQSGTAAGLDGKQFSAAPGDTVRLSGQLRASNGTTSSPGTLAWRSTDAAIVEVDAQGLVRAKANGTASVIATAGSFADTLRVVVSACGSVRPIELAVGQVQAFDTGQGMDLCVLAGTGTQDFALIPYFATDSASRSVRLSVTAGNVAPVAADASGLLADGSALLSRAPSGGALTARSAVDAPRVTDVALHRALRRRAAVELDGARTSRARVTMRTGATEAFARRLAPGPRASRSASADVAPATTAGLAAPGAVAQVAVPRVGDLLRLNARVTSACDTVSTQFRTGRVAAVTDRAIVVADTENPSGGFTDAEYRAFATTFDTLAYPVDVANFGDPSDVDKNSRVVLFFTRTVNEQTPRNVEYVVGGFFWERDLFPNNVSRDKGGCPGSNAAEMFYMLVPDPSGTINGNVRSKTYVSEQTVGTLAHEFQHLINAAHRLYVTDADDYEDVWLNEGLSHIAEELTFYRAAGLGPRTRVSQTTVRASNSTYDMFTLYGNDNVRRVMTYLRDPEGRSPFGEDDDLETRGATWQFLRYAADRLLASGGREADLWKRLVDGKKFGRPNLQAGLGATVPLDDWFRDWAVANFADALNPALTGLDTRYTFPSWGFRSIITNYVDQAGRSYALQTRTLANDVTQSVRLIGGSASYLRFSAAAGRQVVVRTRLDAAPRQGGVKMSVVRVR